MSEKTKIPMFQKIADEISDAVENVIVKYTPEIKRRRCSPNLVNYWISEGARKGADKTIYKKHIARLKRMESLRQAR